MAAALKSASQRSLIRDIQGFCSQRNGRLLGYFSNTRACTLPLIRHGGNKVTISAIRGRVASFQQANYFTTAPASRKRRHEEHEKPSGSPPASEKSELVRRLMRLVPHPVAIITSIDSTTSSGQEDDISHRWRGATVSSFNTVTLDPTPIVSFNIKRQSATFNAIENSGMFNVHLLNNVSEAEVIAARFAGGNAANPFHDSQGEVASFVRGSESQVESSTSLGSVGRTENLPPIIDGQNVNGNGGTTTAFRLQCEYLHDKTVGIGDHVIVFGQVAEVERAGTETSGTKTCLVYVDRRYGVVR